MSERRVQKIRGRLDDNDVSRRSEYYGEDVPWLLDELEELKRENRSLGNDLDDAQDELRHLRAEPERALVDVECGRCGTSNNVDPVDGGGWQRSPKPKATLCPACLEAP